MTCVCRFDKYVIIFVLMHSRSLIVRKNHLLLKFIFSTDKAMFFPISFLYGFIHVCARVYVLYSFVHLFILSIHLIPFVFLPQQKKRIFILVDDAQLLSLSFFSFDMLRASVCIHVRRVKSIVCVLFYISY